MLASTTVICFYYNAGISRKPNKNGDFYGLDKFKYAQIKCRDDVGKIRIKKKMIGWADFLRSLPDTFRWRFKLLKIACAVFLVQR